MRSDAKVYINQQKNAKEWYNFNHGDIMGIFTVDPWPLPKKVQKNLQILVHYTPVPLPEKLVGSLGMSLEIAMCGGDVKLPCRAAKRGIHNNSSRFWGCTRGPKQKAALLKVRLVEGCHADFMAVWRVLMDLPNSMSSILYVQGRNNGATCN